MSKQKQMQKYQNNVRIAGEMVGKDQIVGLNEKQNQRWLFDCLTSTRIATQPPGNRDNDKKTIWTCILVKDLSYAIDQ